MSILVKHFVLEPKVLLTISELRLEKDEKEKLTEIALLVYHQKLLNKFLDKLAEADKRIFMEKLLSGPQEESIEFLHEKIVGIEKVVDEAIFEIETILLADIAALK